MLKKEYEIILTFIVKPWKKYTFKDIKKFTKKKSESYLFNTLKMFVKQNILMEEKAGNVVLYSFNLNSEKAHSYFGFISEYVAWNKKNIPYNDIENLIKKISTGFFIFLITGSYANNTQKKDSDIDVVIICDDSFEPKKIYSELRYDAEMNIPQIHLYIFRKSEFLNMLLDSKANYGKEVAKNNLILTGGEEYYRIISGVIKNGFNG